MHDISENDRAIQRWLQVCLVLVFAMIILGGVTRLTDSGLSMVTWHPTGMLPPLDTEQWLVETVRQQAQQAGIGMPEVGIFQSPQPNAFATGWNRNAALVAVSTGLLQQMNEGEVEAVLGHEVSHVANGDMVTLALIQGVVNTFVVFLARVIGQVVDSALSGGRDGGRVGDRGCRRGNRHHRRAGGGRTELRHGGGHLPDGRRCGRVGSVDAVGR